MFPLTHIDYTELFWGWNFMKFIPYNILMGLCRKWTYLWWNIIFLTTFQNHAGVCLQNIRVDKVLNCSLNWAKNRFEIYYSHLRFWWHCAVNFDMFCKVSVDNICNIFERIISSYAWTKININYVQVRLQVTKKELCLNNLCKFTGIIFQNVMNIM